MDKIKNALWARGKNDELVGWVDELDTIANQLESKAETYQSIVEIRPFQNHRD